MGTQRTEPSQGQEGAVYNRLAVFRAERGMSRQQLADALNINHQTVGYIERGDYNPSLELALRVSELFNVPIEAIFSRRRFKPLSEELYGRSPQEAKNR